MDSLTLQSSISLAERIAIFGFLLVIVGVIGEICELSTKWAKNPKRLKRYFDGEYRRLILGIAKRTKHHALEYESAFFFILVLGLAIEILGSAGAMLLQDKQNAALQNEIKTLWIKQGSRTFRLLNLGFFNKLKSAPAGKVSILFEANNPEVDQLTHVISSSLKSAGWQILLEAPVTPENIRKAVPGLPVEGVELEIARARADDGVAIFLPYMGLNDPYHGLSYAFLECGISTAPFGGGVESNDAVAVFIPRRM